MMLLVAQLAERRCRVRARMWGLSETQGQQSTHQSTAATNIPLTGSQTVRGHRRGLYH
jgi:hypothetical protein